MLQPPYIYYIATALLFLFPFIQAIGVVFFKSSLDPLSNISALDFMKLVSENQVPTDSYWDSMVKDITPDSEEDKNTLVEIFMEKISSCSSYLPSRKGSEVSQESRRSYLFSTFNDAPVLTESERGGSQISQLNQSVHSDEDTQ